MERRFLTSALLALIMVMIGIPTRAAQNQHEIEILKVMRNLDDAWNRHDMKAFANQFAEDADQLNVVGWWWKGRSEIEKKLTAAHSYIFRESTHSDDEVHIKFLTPEIAVVHVLW